MFLPSNCLLIIRPLTYTRAKLLAFSTVFQSSFFFDIATLSCDSLKKYLAVGRSIWEIAAASRVNFYLFCFILIYSCKSVDFVFSSAWLLRQWNKNADVCSCTNTSISICICIFGRGCRCICIFGTAATTLFISMFSGSVLLFLPLSDLSAIRECIFHYFGCIFFLGFICVFFFFAFSVNISNMYFAATSTAAALTWVDFIAMKTFLMCGNFCLFVVVVIFPPISLL